MTEQQPGQNSEQEATNQEDTQSRLNQALQVANYLLKKISNQITRQDNRGDVDEE
jgi:hypothetical protein